MDEKKARGDAFYTAQRRLNVRDRRTLIAMFWRMSFILRAIKFIPPAERRLWRDRMEMPEHWLRLCLAVHRALSDGRGGVDLAKLDAEFEGLQAMLWDCEFTDERRRYREETELM